MQRFATDISSGLTWFGKTVRALLSVHPWQTWRIVLISLVSQVGIIVAFVLPLKVIIMLGSSRIPRYFPDWFHNFPRDDLIYGLSAVALVFYLLHLTSERIASKALNTVSQYLVGRADKITTRPNQNLMARSAYEEIVSSLTGVVFFCLASTALGFLYPNLLIVLIIFLVLASAITFYLGEVDNRMRLYLRENLPNYLVATYAIGFLSTFGFVVADYLVPIDPPGLIFALFGFVMVRQILAGANSSIQNITKVYRNRRKAQELLFPEHTSRIDTVKEARFWSILNPDVRNQWIHSELEQITNCNFSEIDSTWHQTSSHGIAAFQVDARDGRGVANRFLIRIFDANRVAQASAEAAILKLEKPPSFALPLLDTIDIGTHHVHVFTWHGMTPVNADNPKHMTPLFNRRLLDTALPDSFIDRYARTHPFLWQRLYSELVTRLLVAATPGDAALVRRLEGQLNRIHAILQGLPMQIIIPKIAVHDVSVCNKSELVLTSWTNWQIEPLGCGWPAKTKEDRAALLAAVKDASIHRPDLKLASCDALLLAANMYQFERLIVSQNLAQALKLLPWVLEQYDRCGDQEGKPAGIERFE